MRIHASLSSKTCKKNQSYTQFIWQRKKLIIRWWKIDDIYIYWVKKKEKAHTRGKKLKKKMSKKELICQTNTNFSGKSIQYLWKETYYCWLTNFLATYHENPPIRHPGIGLIYDKHLQHMYPIYPSHRINQPIDPMFRP